MRGVRLGPVAAHRFNLESQGRFAEALAAYREALARDDSDAEALLDGIARCESALGIGEDLPK